MKKSTLDELIELGQGPSRSLDCVISLKTKTPLEKDLLLERIAAVRKVYPLIEVPSFISRWASLDGFSNESSGTPELALIHEPDGEYLALKMSHVLGDAVSMLSWLKVILGKEATPSPMKLRAFPPKKDTPYRGIRNAEAWNKGIPKCRDRKTLRVKIRHDLLPEDQGLNDLFILSLLRSLPQKRKAVWLPVNVREKFWEGFGNGLSRMRVYPPPGVSTRDQLRHIRQQKAEAFKNGEISLPPENLNLSSPLTRTCLRLWLKRPWADWGTLSLSHLQDKQGEWREVETLWGVTNLIEKHQAGLFAWTSGTTTCLTLTLDKNVPAREGEALLNDFQKNFREILHELSP